MENVQRKPKLLSFNHVNIIGKIASNTTVSVLPGGSKVVRFSVTTKEQYLDKDGSLCVKQDYHRMSAFGRWVRIMEEMCNQGASVAVEGRLVSRFYMAENGERKMFSEIEVNDLIVL